MRIEVWSDVICPFCYIGKAELTKALATFAHADEVDVVYRSFELDPQAPRTGQDPVASLADKYGMSREQVAANNDQVAARAGSVGLAFDWAASKPTNTFDAHRIVKLAETENKSTEVVDALMKAYFAEGELVSDHEVLVRIATDAGLDEARVRQVLDGIEFAEDVHTDEQEAAAYGATAVPFFLFDGQWAVTGAQPADMLGQALDQVWSETHKPRFITLGAEFDNAGGGCGCGGGSCGCGAH
ncbi:DsbA family oxidoreductase [Brooklawnia cerclae]|uniref:DsbA family dithiol-disulfide isomerase n=1 Tax=Brooklawnia cerclae TaxID=349934 RepID=A0ABX0SB65_9ACTN|nr:DsbA family oxidoreductase [Brooklawnia cerclae]NIH55638.1 putative DsbA family dithiol-disulfide isomerase [Brooklawnia cerclae]